MDKKRIMDAAYETILKADEDKAMELIDEAFNLKLDLLEILKTGFNSGNKEVGKLFENGQISIPELILSTEVMKNVTNKIQNLMNIEDIQKRGKVIIATVEGDIHDIGKGIVAVTAMAEGIDVIDLGRDVSVDTIIEKAEEHEAKIICTSALLTTTLMEQRKLEEKLKELCIRDKYITIVGGAPCTPRWAKKIGADFYCEDAIDVARKANEILNK